jgi:hypothetical protein
MLLTVFHPRASNLMMLNITRHVRQASSSSQNFWDKSRDPHLANDIGKDDSVPSCGISIGEKEALCLGKTQRRFVSHVRTCRKITMHSSAIRRVGWL